jgi:hypothetical protein
MIELSIPTLPLAIRGRSQMFDTADRVDRAAIDGPYLRLSVPLCGTYCSLISATDWNLN